MAYNAATVLQVISDPPVQKGMLKLTFIQMQSKKKIYATLRSFQNQNAIQ